MFSAYTGNQNTRNAPRQRYDEHRSMANGDDPYRPRRAGARLQPKSFHRLGWQTQRMAIRAPTPNVSSVDLMSLTSKSALSVEAINNALTAAAEGSLKGVLGVTTDPVVSVDMVGTFTPC